MFKNLRLGTKLISGYVGVALIIVVVAVMGYSNVKSMHAGLKTLYDDRVLPLEQLGSASENVNKIWADVNRLALIPDDRARIEQSITLEAAEIKKQMDLYRATYLVPEEKTGLAEFDATWPLYQKAVADVGEQIKAGKKDAAMGDLSGGGRVSNARKAVLDPLGKLVAIQVKVSDQIDREGASAFKRITWSSLTAGILGMLLAVALGVAITRAITRPMAKTVRLLQEMGLGHLNGRLKMDSRDEIGVMAAAMDQFADDLQGVVVGAMKRIAEGDLGVEVTCKDAEDEIAPALRETVESLRSMVADTDMLARAAVEGRLGVRADATKHSGAYRKIVEGINNTIDRLVGYLNTMPAPAMIIDKDMNVLYINEMGAKVGGRMPEEVVGRRCYEHYKNSDCRTERCTCTLAMREGRACSGEAEAHPAAGVDLEISYTGVPIRDLHGNVIGAFEFVTDQTAVKKAARLAGKIAQYQSVETGKVVDALGKLACGNTQISLAPAEADGDTKDAKEIFDTISGAVNTCVGAVRSLVDDADMLAEAASEGRLATRADASRHQGDFRKVVEGVNRTLDALVGPLNVAAKYVDDISKGDIPARITDEYRGDFNEIKKNLNILIEAMNEVTTIAEEIAGGNLTVKVRERSGEDKLMQAVSKMVGGLTEIVSDIRTVAGQVMSGSQEMSGTAEQISQGASEQSASVEEISSSMEEMSANIKQNSDNAQQTEKIALKAAEDAGQGGKAVTETVLAMKEIAGKISIIEEIARQTDLLALNAAIEAARAGEHGRGFAVVASEVRKLAERSQTAAGEINKLAGSSVQVAENAGIMLERIVPDIQKTADLVQEINAAGNEQSVGASQVNQAVQQLDSVVQQNASASEEMASMAEELMGQAEQLLNTIAFFKMNGSGSGCIGSTAIPAPARALTGAAQNHPPKAGQLDTPTSLKRLAAPARGARPDNGKAKGIALSIGKDARCGNNARLDDEFENY